MQHRLLLQVFCVTALAGTLPCSAAPTEMPIALHTMAGRYISASPKGGLILGGDTGRDRTTFTLVDVNGGALADRDAVQIRFGTGKGSSLWREAQGTISRAGGHSDKTSLFRVRWKQQGRSLQLQAASGKFVSAPAPGKSLVTAAASDPATVFDIEKNPAPQQPRAEASPKRPAAPESH